MYFLLNMGIFQPAMLVYQRVQHICPPFFCSGGCSHAGCLCRDDGCSHRSTSDLPCDMACGGDLDVETQITIPSGQFIMANWKNWPGVIHGVMCIYDTCFFFPA